MLNVDEILRIPSTKLLVILRGNKPLLLDKVMYKEHPLSHKLQDSSISEYTPNWTKNVTTNVSKKKNTNKKPVQSEKPEEKLGWNNF